ncbi:unnamed protein product [Arabidopsis halleri]
MVIVGATILGPSRLSTAFKSTELCLQFSSRSSIRVVAVAKFVLCSLRSLFLLGVCWEDPPYDELLFPVNGQLPLDLFARGRPMIWLVLQPLSSPSVGSSWRFRVLLLRWLSGGSHLPEDSSGSDGELSVVARQVWQLVLVDLDSLFWKHQWC